MGTMAVERACPLCGGRKAKLVRPLRYTLFDDLGLSGLSPLMACEICGQVYNDLQGGSGALLNYYQSNDHYLMSTTPGSGGADEADTARYRRLHSLLGPGLAPVKPVLDVGCGKGGLLSYLAQHGFMHLAGIEASRACRKALVKRAADFSVFETVGNLPDIFKPSMVVLSHVIEHFHDPVSELRALVDVAAPDALFFLEVPNTPAMLDSALPWLWLYFEHINHFDLSHLKLLVRQAGLEPVREGCWPFQLKPGAEDDCLYLVCRIAKSVDASSFSLVGELADFIDQRLPPHPLNEKKCAEILDDGRPLALWGLSQYSMLVLGMHDEIRQRITALFDNSPAKTGRYLAGIEVRPVESMLDLGADHLLLLPQSGYTLSMEAYLSGHGVESRHVVF